MMDIQLVIVTILVAVAAVFLAAGFLRKSKALSRSSRCAVGCGCSSTSDGPGSAR